MSSKGFGLIPLTFTLCLLISVKPKPQEVCRVLPVFHRNYLLLTCKHELAVSRQGYSYFTRVLKLVAEVCTNMRRMGTCCFTVIKNIFYFLYSVMM